MTLMDYLLGMPFPHFPLFDFGLPHVQPSGTGGRRTFKM